MHAARRVQYAPAERGNFRAIESPDANRHIIKEFPSSSASWRRVRPDERVALGLCVRILRVTHPPLPSEPPHVAAINELRALTKA